MLRKGEGRGGSRRCKNEGGDNVDTRVVVEISRNTRNCGGLFFFFFVRSFSALTCGAVEWMGDRSGTDDLKCSTTENSRRARIGVPSSRGND